MKRKTTLLILATAFIMSGCTPAFPDNISKSADGQESETSDTSVDSTSESDASVTATSDSAISEVSSEAENLSDEELDEFTKMFVFTGEYFGFLWPEYSSPEEIKWDQVIAYRTEGLTLDETKFTDEEKMEFYGTTDIDGYMVDTVMKRTDLAVYIKKCTGLDFCPEPKDVPGWTYNEKYDSFLISDNPWGNGSSLPDGKFVSGTKTGNLYELRYHVNDEDSIEQLPDRLITFTKSGDNLVIKSNKLLNK